MRWHAQANEREEQRVVCVFRRLNGGGYTDSVQCLRGMVWSGGGEAILAV